MARWLGRFEPPVRPVRMKQCVRMAGSNLRFTRAGSGWMGNGVGTRSAKLSAHLALQNSRNITFLVIFSIFHFGGCGPRKVDDLVTSPNNQFRDYFIRNRLEKLVPVINITSPRTLKSEKIIDQTVFKPWLLAEIWVSKKPGFVSGSPPGGLYFQKWPQNKKSGKLQKP